MFFGLVLFVRREYTLGVVLRRFGSETATRFVLFFCNAMDRSGVGLRAEERRGARGRGRGSCVRYEIVCVCSLYSLSASVGESIALVNSVGE